MEKIRLLIAWPLAVYEMGNRNGTAFDAVDLLGQRQSRCTAGYGRLLHNRHFTGRGRGAGHTGILAVENVKRRTGDIAGIHDIVRVGVTTYRAAVEAAAQRICRIVTIAVKDFQHQRRYVPGIHFFIVVAVAAYIGQGRGRIGRIASLTLPTLSSTCTHTTRR